MNEECVERLIEHEAEPSVLLCLETHSSFTISGRVRVSGYSNWFSVGGESPLGYVHSIVYPKVFLNIVQARAIETLWHNKALSAQWSSAYYGK